MIYGILNGINVTFSVTVVPNPNFYVVSEYSANRDSRQKIEVGLAFGLLFCRCSNKDCSSKSAEI